MTLTALLRRLRLDVEGVFGLEGEWPRGIMRLPRGGAALRGVHVRELLMNGQRVLWIAAVVLAPASAWAQTSVTIDASADNTMFSDSPHNSNGQGPGLFAGTIATGGHRRALLKFDLSGIPAHAPIASATLTLHMNKTVSGAASFKVHRLLEDWGEGASNAGDPGGGGTIASPGDATWNFAFYNTIPWSTPGGMFEATASATASVNQIGDYSWSASLLKADVQRWVDAPAENLGWILIGPETLLNTAKRFDSRTSPATADRPRLVVEYYCPADFDQNSFVNGDDFDAFVALFEFGDPGADWDRNTFVNGDDFDGFVLAFEAGC